ncbi:MAG: hypothetical protein KC550_03540, partial [Nanoarchaeota archaeon]|nr:hypothetical protein [Nanoarchaeota archaeon]
MKELVKSDVLKIKILSTLKKSNKVVSLSELEKISGINYNSLFPNCIFLNKLNYIHMIKKSSPNKEFFEITITKLGIDNLELLNKEPNFYDESPNTFIAISEENKYYSK